MTANLETRQFGFQKKKKTTANSETQQPNQKHDSKFENMTANSKAQFRKATAISKI